MRHKQLMEAKRKAVSPINSFFISSVPSTSSSTATSQAKEENATSSVTSLENFVTGNNVLEAEVLWALKCIKSHYSFKSSEDSSKLFRLMFPDSQIAKQFTCGERKCSYICNFGLAPYFQKMLLKTFEDINHYTLLFDETLNRTHQRKQMDIYVRFWHVQSNEVRTCYLTSCFMGHSASDDLLNAFYKATETLNLSKVLQISMDGPAVNWKFYEILQEDLLREKNIQCVSVGSCGLHIVNNAFKKGVEKTDWNLLSILSSLYWLLKDSPARREDFLKVASQQKFPVKFCQIRWLENISAAERAIEIWEDVVKFVKNVENGKFSKICCKSFNIISEATKDSTMVIKLNAFLSVAKIIQPFLEMYQNDKPLLPFFADDIFKLTKQCLEHFLVLKADVFDNISSIEKLIKFDFLAAKHFETKSKVSLGFISDKIIKEKLFKKEITPGDVMNLKYSFQGFILSMFHHLFLKCPVRYRLVRNICCIDPRMMASDSFNSKNKMKQVLLQLVEKKQLSEKNGDALLSEYSTFLENVVKKFHSIFENFDPKSQALDKFFSQYFQDGQYPKLWEVMKMLLILSHGQAAIERGFSINKQIEIENLREASYVSQRIIYDSIKFAGSIFNIPITKEMKISVSSARSKYMIYLEEEKKLKETENSKRKRKELLDEIKYLNQKKRHLENDINQLEKEIDTTSENAEANKDICLFIKSNGLRKSVKEKKVDIAEIEIILDKSKKDFKKMSIF